MLVVCYFLYWVIKTERFSLALDFPGVFPRAEMVRCHRPADDLAVLGYSDAFRQTF
jgi:hypothetical protein